MRSVLVDGLLVVLVGAAWLGVGGFARLRTALDRLHCISFINTVCGLLLVAIAFVAEGASSRAVKILFIVALNLLSGAVISHATGRAIVNRGEDE